MPLDDHRVPRRDPGAPEPEQLELHEDDGAGLGDVERAELHRALMVECRRRLADVREGRVQAIPWDDALNRRMFAR